MPSESKRLAEYSDAVRESTLHFLKKVPPGKENWTHPNDGMTYSDVARHLWEADHWLMKMVEKREYHSMDPRPGEKAVRDRREYEALLEELGKVKIQKRSFIEGLSDEKLGEIIEHSSFEKMSVWWAIVRWNLDHETHHRGQIEAYLKMGQD